MASASTSSSAAVNTQTQSQISVSDPQPKPLPLPLRQLQLQLQHTMFIVNAVVTGTGTASGGSGNSNGGAAGAGIGAGVALPAAVADLIAAYLSVAPAASAAPMSTPPSAIGPIGVIVHWGLYSVPAFDDIASARARKLQNGAEWYAKRLSVKGSRGTDGFKETQKWHTATYGTKLKYSAFKGQFTAAKWDVDAWMRAFKAAGATYAILTAKHHDGFCLWPTATAHAGAPFATTTSSTASSAVVQYRFPTADTAAGAGANAGAGAAAATAAGAGAGAGDNSDSKAPSNSAVQCSGADLIADFKAACERWGLVFGVYYSWGEFAHAPATAQYMACVVRPQIDELIERYKPRVWWFDGDWFCGGSDAQRVMDDCVRAIRMAIPGVDVNDRIGHSAERKSAEWLGAGASYRVYADRHLPAATPKVAWEHINTIGISWGRNKQQTAADYKSGAQLLALYERVRALRGRFLLNVGPDAEGTICDEELNALKAFGQFLALHQRL